MALNPSAPARKALAAIATGVRDVAWADPSQYHLTLRFIGPATPELQRAIELALARVSVRSFFLPVEGVGAFPPRGRPNVLWAGTGRGHPLLHQLRQQVDDSLLAAAVPLELRAFVPHFTLGRCADAATVAVQHWLKKHRDFAGPIWPVESFELMNSISRPGGPEYRTVRSYGLGK